MFGRLAFTRAASDVRGNHRYTSHRLFFGGTGRRSDNPGIRNHHRTGRNRDNTGSGRTEPGYFERNKPPPLRSTTLRLLVSSDGKEVGTLLVLGVHATLGPSEETRERKMWLESVLPEFPPRALELWYSISHRCRTEHHGRRHWVHASAGSPDGKNCEIYVSWI